MREAMMRIPRKAMNVHATSMVLCATTVFFVPVVRADIDVGSDGSDGAFTATNTPIDLSLAASNCDCDGDGQVDDPCRWDCPSPVPGRGVYDAEQWAVVFKYQTVTVPSGVTARFVNHASGAPVVWLVKGTVSIVGGINLNGVRGHNHNENRFFSQPGPGGFRGGRGGHLGSLDACGLGPGGAQATTTQSDGTGGSYATTGAGGCCAPSPAGPTYGNSAILPLIGGSGGSGGSGPTSGLDTSRTPANSGGGGAGGGAILIAANRVITLAGTVSANGGASGENALGISPTFSACGSLNARGDGGSGSGGAVRLLADSVNGSGRLRATSGGGSTSCGDGSLTGGRGGFGRIRVEANAITLTDPGDPLFVPDLPTFPFPPPNYPKLRAVLLDTQEVPEDPRAGIIDPNNDPDLRIISTSSLPLVIEAENLPEGTPVQVTIIPKSGACSTFISTPLMDSKGTLKATANVQFPPGFSVVQLRATFLPQAFEAHGMARPKWFKNIRTLSGEGVIATEAEPLQDGASQTVYVTETGRRITVGSR